jgi:SAM-dependent methyltransferase
MAQVATGVRHLLSRPSVYDFFQNLVGVTASRDRWVRDFVKPFPGARILDIGCGTGEIRRHLPEAIDYLGFDLSEAYIASARKRHGSLGRFECRRVEDFAKSDGMAGALGSRGGASFRMCAPRPEAYGQAGHRRSGIRTEPIRVIPLRGFA